MPGEPPAGAPAASETPAQPPAGPERDAEELALQISQCGEIVEAQRTARHPCRRIVSVQAGSGGERHVPEAWAGNLLTGRILFISSNPSLSEAGDHQSGALVERYPLASWPAADKVDFFMHRFSDAPDAHATPEGRFRRTDGSLSPHRVQFWAQVRKRAQELLGPAATPEHDYCMTEVVHCKSKAEKGVAQAAPLCASRYLDRIVALSPAQLVVVVGAKARERAISIWALPADFGSAASMEAAPDRSVAVRHLGGRDRVVAYLPHPTGMTKLRTFTQVYGRKGIDLGRVAREELTPGDLLSELAPHRLAQSRQTRVGDDS